MKKIYIQPQTKVELAQCEVMLAASAFNINNDSQSITPLDDEYDDEFAVREYSFDDDF